MSRCYEDFVVGEIIRHSLGRTVTTTDNIWFTLLTANTNPIHFDAHYAAQTEFGKPLGELHFHAGVGHRPQRRRYLAARRQSRLGRSTNARARV